jgi:glutaredoxin 3
VKSVVIYSKPFCGYCTRVKAMFERRGIAVEEVMASMDPLLRKEMRERSGRMTYPQVFIDGRHIGGCHELTALDSDGGLDEILAA